MIHQLRTSSITTSVTGIALAAALLGGGSAVAARVADDSVESRHIKDGTIRSVDVANGSLTGRDVDEASLGIVPVAEAADTADRATFAGHAETARRLLGSYRATVSASGELRSTDFGAVTASQADVPGRYVVTLDGPVLGCSLVAGVAHNRPEPAVGSASAWITPFAANPTLSKITVETHGAGAGDAVPDPRPFTLMVFC